MRRQRDMQRQLENDLAAQKRQAKLKGWKNVRSDVAVPGPVGVPPSNVGGGLLSQNVPEMGAGMGNIGPDIGSMGGGINMPQPPAFGGPPSYAEFLQNRFGGANVGRPVPPEPPLAGAPPGYAEYLQNLFGGFGQIPQRMQDFGNNIYNQMGSYGSAMREGLSGLYNNLYGGSQLPPDDMSSVGSEGFYTPPSSPRGMSPQPPAFGGPPAYRDVFGGGYDSDLSSVFSDGSLPDYLRNVPSVPGVGGYSPPPSPRGRVQSFGSDMSAFEDYLRNLS